MAPFSYLGFVRDQLFHSSTLPVAKADLTGKTAIVTGSNVGLGLESARHLASMNPAHLILAVRSVDKGEKAKADILNTTGYTGKLEVWHLDLSSFDNVRKFAERVERECNRLDILLENAGIASNAWNTTPDNWELTLQTNVLSTTLLALLLLPLLRRTVRSDPTSTPRLILVGSEVHFWAKFPEQDAERPLAALNDQSRFLGQDRYFISKLLDLIVARKIASVLRSSTFEEDKKISVYCPNPGFCFSELGREDQSWGFYLFQQAIARTTEQGSRTFVWCAAAPEAAGAGHDVFEGVGGEKSSGVFWSECKPREESDWILSEKGQAVSAKVWGEIKEVMWKEGGEKIKDVLKDF
ncbi:hypothetical protein YB2330_004137 [Saitoella coloradoensis]